MAQAALSAAEAALENQRIGGLQLRVAALCTLVQICDGYDLNSVAWAVPSLIREWHLPPSMFAMAFLWSSVGILVGALSAGPIGDRFGRRPLLLTSLTIFGCASLLSATAGSLGMLSFLRFFTGLGIGGGFSGAAALTGDYAPHRLRATMIMISFTGAPLGGFVGGQIVALLLAHYDWSMIFVLGGAFPLLLVPALALWLPESPRFLTARENLSPRHAALLRRLDRAGAGPGKRSGLRRHLHQSREPGDLRLSFRCGKRALQSPPRLDDASDRPGLGGRTAREVRAVTEAVPADTFSASAAAPSRSACAVSRFSISSSTPSSRSDWRRWVASTALVPGLISVFSGK